MNRATAAKIISEVITAVKVWNPLAIRLGIIKREMDLFGDVFEGRINAFE